MVSSCRNNGTISQELRYPFTGTVVQFWQESSIKQLLTHEEREDMLWYGNTLLHFSLGTLTTPKGTIDLTSYESKILHAFFEHPQCIISRAELLNINNAQNYNVSDRSIDVRISIIRKKLIAISSNLSLLSRRGCGYILTISS